MEFLFEQYWFLSELHPWLSYQSSLSLSVVSKSYWKLFQKPYTIIRIYLSKRIKYRPIIFDSSDIIGLYIFPPNSYLSIERIVNIYKRFLTHLINYWLSEHSQIHFIKCYKNIFVNHNRFRSVASKVLISYGFFHHYENKNFLLWSKNEFQI